MVYVIYLRKTSNFVKVIVSLCVTEEGGHRVNVFSVFPLIAITNKATKLELSKSRLVRRSVMYSTYVFNVLGNLLVVDTSKHGYDVNL
jgi:hypothetical protein